MERLEKFNWRSIVSDILPDASQISPWLLRTRWHEKIKVADMPELFQFAAFPSGRRDEDLDWLHEEVVGYFQKATKLMPATAELVLQQLNSADPDKDGLNNTPLTEHQKGDITLQNYAREITSFLASLLRTSGAFSYPTTASLTAALAKMRDDGLHSVFRALWMTTWLRSAECHMPDPTMCFLMLRSIKQTGEFNGPSDTTQPIARLSWGIKLVCLTEVHDMVQRGESESQMEAINTVVKWCREKEYTSFAALQSLKHYANAISGRTWGMPKIWWTDREHWSELMFKGNIVCLDQLTTIFGKLEAKLTDMWENKVLMGLGLHVEYGQLAEDLGNTELGYCFLDDPRNPFGDQEHRLLRAIYNSPELRARFFTQDGLNGRACRQWLGLLAEFEEVLMLDEDMCGGAPPRGTELANALIRNTRTRTRNLVGLGKYVTLIRQYNKTTHQKGDQIIPHALNAFAADLLIQLHVLARPLARLFAHHCMPDRPNAVFLYSNLLFVGQGKPFTTDDISNVMVRETIDILGWSMTISIWRHINIAFRRKHLSEVDTEDSNANFNAQQAGHSKGLEDQFYGLSQHALAGIPEDLLFPFMHVSIDYQMLIKVVPGGLGLKYQDATADQFAVHQAKAPSSSSAEHIVLRRVVPQQVETPPRSSADRTLVQITPPSVQDIRQLFSRRPTQARMKQLEPKQTVIDLTNDDDDDDVISMFSSSFEVFSMLMLSCPVTTSPTASPSKFDPPSDAQLLAVLRQLEGPQANWKTPEQYQAVRAVADWKGDVMIASATGSGKTMAAVIPALLDNQYTVIVLPLIALIEDWERRLTAKKIPYERFLGSRQPTLQGRANIILVTSDLQKKSSWDTAISVLQKRTGRMVRRVVPDEAHYYFTDLGFRREAFTNPETLRIGESQLVLMSASFHPAARNFAKKKFKLTNLQMITGSSDRPELNLVI
ncbi:hypothetical protein GGX14DRAFT_369082, partial [Mycena pura]